MTFHTTKPRADDIAAAIRNRICLHPGEEQQLLLEGTIAAEFGVSRTPVRQALQRLAYEGLIEICTGVGSVVTPMEPAQRHMHFAVHGRLLGLVACLPDVQAPRDIKTLLGMIAMQYLSDRPMEAQTVYAAFTELNALLSRMIPDPVIADAHMVSGWRIVRWYLSDTEEEYSAPIDMLQELFKVLPANADMGAAAMFQKASHTFLQATT